MSTYQRELTRLVAEGLKPGSGAAGDPLLWW